ncbi:MAG: S8 family serine peptidase [Saprospiraceae bacterium]|nr:S8 family serine peptidase [Saprospiraceae bacterium]
MKKIRNLLLLCIGLPHFLLAQVGVDTSAFQFFIQLDGIVPEDTIIAYLTDLNATEVWRNDNVGIALWQANGYPFVTAEGVQVTDIYTIIRESARKTKIQEATFDILTSLGDIQDNATGSCFDIADYTMAQGNGEKVKISILDTGISPNIASSTTGHLNYNLLDYTGYDYINSDDEPEDDNGHGTHIAGIIHSITNGISITGTKVSFDIRKTHNAQGQGMTSDIVKALLDASADHADIVNMSFGMPDAFIPSKFFPLRLAINHLSSEGILVICAAGNEGKNIDVLSNTTLPAGFPDPGILSISAFDCSEELAVFSNFGSENTDISAPGFKIPGPDMAGGLRYASGTSQATAVATGVAALVLTHGAVFDFGLLKCALINGAIEIPALSGLSVSEGIINTANAKALYQAPQAGYTVTSYHNNGIGSLRFGIEKTCGVSQIDIDPSLNGIPLQISGNDLIISSNTIINGLGMMTSEIQLDGNVALKINPGSMLHLSNLSINKSGSQATIINQGNLILGSNVKIE